MRIMRSIRDIVLLSMAPRLTGAGIPNPHISIDRTISNTATRVSVIYNYWDVARVKDLESGRWDIDPCFLRRKIGYIIEISDLVTLEMLNIQVEYHTEKIIEDWKSNREVYHKRAEGPSRPSSTVFRYT